MASRPHDHSHCVSHALTEAESICTRQGLRLTALRKRVPELVWHSHKPLGAYDILGVLSEEDGRRAAPPTVYRALISLETAWYTASLTQCLYRLQPSRASTPGSVFDLPGCSAAIELEQATISDAIVGAAADVGFVVERQTVEVVGLRAGCREHA